MGKFIKDFKKIIPESISYVIVVVLAVFAVYDRVVGVDGFFNFLRLLLPVLLMAVAAIYLQVKGKGFPAHLVLLLGVYNDAGARFINAFLSLQFEPEFGWQIPFWDIQLILGFLAFLYLLFYSISCIMNGAGKTSLNASKLWLPIILLGIYAYLRVGLGGAFLVILTPVIALMFGSGLAAGLLLLSTVIIVPINAIDLIVSGNAGGESIGYWIYVAFAVLLIYLSIVALLELKDEK